EHVFDGTTHPVTAVNDSAGSINEGFTAGGNVLTNDTGSGGIKALTSVTYNGTTYQLSATDPVVINLKDAGGTLIRATLTSGLHGDDTVDAIKGDALCAGQKVGFDVLYEVKQTVLESNGSIAGWVTSSAHLSGEIVGLDTNDNAPVWATDPTQTVAENTTL